MTSALHVCHPILLLSLWAAKRRARLSANYCVHSCLIAIGASVGILASSIAREHNLHAITLILVLVLPSEGMNAVGMRRVGSPYVVPLFFILLTVAGAALVLLASNTE